MKLFLIVLTFAASSAVLAQHRSGIDPQEVKEMIALANSYPYLDLYGDDSSIIPKGYKKVYTSPVVGMDNMFQVYVKGNRGVISFRGSTDKKSSWLENIYSAMIPVQGEIKIPSRTFHYQFGLDTASNVHSGYALSIAYLEPLVITQINDLNKKGIYQIYITGHSQGGALSVLMRSQLEYGSKRDISSKNDFKVYTFAQPMSGNKAFVQEYNKKFCAQGKSYSFVNPDDMVPQMPASYNDSTFLKDNIVALFSREDQIDKSQLVKQGLMLLFEDKLRGTVHKFGESVSKQIQKELGEVSLPEPTQSINYAQVGNQVLLPPPYYPLEMKDSSLLKDSEWMARYPQDENGIFINKNVYKKTSMGLNHKPYNYYTAVLRKYYPKEYDAIEPKSYGL